MGMQLVGNIEEATCRKYRDCKGGRVVEGEDTL